MNIVKELLLPCLYSTILSASFAVQYNIRPKHLTAAAIGAMASRLVYIMLSMRDAGSTGCCFAAAAAAALYSEILARIMKAPVNMYLITSIIPLVPGSTLYYAMSSLTMDDLDSAADFLRTAVLNAGAIAVGIFIVSTFIRIISQFGAKPHGKSVGDRISGSK